MNCNWGFTHHIDKIPTNAIFKRLYLQVSVFRDFYGNALLSIVFFMFEHQVPIHLSHTRTHTLSRIIKWGNKIWPAMATESTAFTHQLRIWLIAGNGVCYCLTHAQMVCRHYPSQSTVSSGNLGQPFVVNWNEIISERKIWIFRCRFASHRKHYRGWHRCMLFSTGEEKKRWRLSTKNPHKSICKPHRKRGDAVVKASGKYCSMIPKLKLNYL